MNNANIDFNRYPKMIHALHFANLQSEAISLAKKENWPVNKILQISSICPSAMSIPCTFPCFITWMASEFHITGNIEYIKTFLQIFEIQKKDLDNQEELKSEIEKAKNILKHLMYAHDRVYKFCKEEVKSSQKESKAILVELLTDLDKSQNDLKGIILISDDPNFEQNWYNSPIMTGPKCTNITTFRYPGENKKIKSIMVPKI